MNPFHYAAVARNNSLELCVSRVLLQLWWSTGPDKILCALKVKMTG